MSIENEHCPSAPVAIVKYEQILSEINTKLAALLEIKQSIDALIEENTRLKTNITHDKSWAVISQSVANESDNSDPQIVDEQEPEPEIEKNMTDFSNESLPDFSLSLDEVKKVVKKKRPVKM